MKEERVFYSVISDLWHTPLPDPLENGYESERDFRAALRRLVDHWHGRTGECVGERNGFLLLRFHDTPGGKPDEAWLPQFLLKAAPVPDYMTDEELVDEVTEELDRIHGFD